MTQLGIISYLKSVLSSVRFVSFANNCRVANRISTETLSSLTVRRFTLPPLMNCKYNVYLPITTLSMLNNPLYACHPPLRQRDWLRRTALFRYFFRSAESILLLISAAGRDRDVRWRIGVRDPRTCKNLVLISQSISAVCVRAKVKGYADADRSVCVRSCRSHDETGHLSRQVERRQNYQISSNDDVAAAASCT